jgi:hypothetical protein
MQIVEITDIGPNWVMLNTTDAVRVQFQNTGTATLEITRGTVATPADDAPAYLVAPTKGQQPVSIDDALIAPDGGRVWVRVWGRAALIGAMTFGWTEA